MLDLFLVGLYFVLLLYVGIKNSSPSLSFKYTDSTPYTTLILTATIFTSSVGGGSIIGLMQKVFNEDMSYVYGILMTIPIDLIIGFLILKKLSMHHDENTLGDILYKSYGNLGKLIGAVGTILISIGYIAAQILVSANVFKYLLNVDIVYGIIFSYGIIIFYTSLGGLKSVIYTNAFQFFGIIIGIPLFSIIMIKNSNANLETYHLKYSLISNSFLLYKSLLVAINFSVSLLTPNFIQRGLLIKNFSTSAKALSYKSFIYLSFITLIGVTSLFLFAEYSALSSQGFNDEEIVNLIFSSFPQGAKAIIAIGVLAASTSTADSDLNLISVSLYQDLYKTFNKNDKKNRTKIFKFITFLIGICSIFIALKLESVIDIIMFSSSFWSPIVLTPMITTLYNFKIHQIQLALISVLTIIFCIWWDYQDFHIKSMFSGFVFNLICFIVCYFYNKRKNIQDRKILI